MRSLSIQNIPDFYPEAMAEYNRAVSVGESRKDKKGNVVLDRKTGQPVMVKYRGTWEKWAAAHSKANPQWLAATNNEFQTKMRDDVNFRLERAKFTPDTLAEIQEFFPEAVAEYESLKANRKIKDRDFLAYAQRMAKDPAWLNTINTKYRNVVQTEIDNSKRELAKDPTFQTLPPEVQNNIAARAVTGGLEDAEAFVRRDPTLAANPQVQAWAARAVTAATSTDKPYEQQFFETTRKYVEDDLARDAQRRQEADQILSNYQPSLDASRQLVTDLTARSDSTRGPLYSGSRMLEQEQNASNQAFGQQLTNMGEQAGTRLGALSDELSAKQSYLDQQIATLGQGLATLNEDQKAALATEVSAKRAALEQELSTLGTAVTKQDADRRAALETQLGELNIAQDLVDKSRIEGARMQGTAINLGAQAEQDRIRADMAQQGFVGGSSGTDMALGRSLIQARQGAAQAVADAGLTNALDRQGIMKYGADTRFGIADNTAGMNFDLSKYGAGETRGLGDYSAEESRTLANTDSQARFKLTDFGAGQQRELSNYGAGERRGLANFVADETRGIKDAGTQRDLDYFDRDVARRIAALSLPAGAISQEFQIRNTADSYAQSGLNRAQNNLNWFNIGTSQAPNTVTNPTQPNTAWGYAFQNLGAGIAGAATDFGLAKMYQSGGAPKKDPNADAAKMGQ